MEIRTFIGRKLDYINGILRVHLELGKALLKFSKVKLSYVYYNPPKNPIDFISKRYFVYPIYSHYLTNRFKNDIVNNISFQYLGDLAHFIDQNKTILTCADIDTFIEKNNFKNPWFIKKYSLSGLKKSKYIMAISDFTKNELVNKFKIPSKNIYVIKCGINHEVFKPINEQKLTKKAKLFSDSKIILHVGTESGKKILSLF